MSTHIPNSFQTPNVFVDLYLSLITEAETKVWLYIARRTYGFQKQQDSISLSLLTDGMVSRTSGEHLDHGTGLSKNAVRRALDDMKKYGLVIEVSPYDSKRSEAAVYRLELDSSKVDVDGLRERASSRSTQDRKRTEQAALARIKPKKRSSRPVSSDDTPPVSSDDIAPVSSSATPPVSSDDTPPVSSDDTTNLKGKHRGNTHTAGVRATPNKRISKGDVCAQKLAPRAEQAAAEKRANAPNVTTGNHDVDGHSGGRSRHSTVECRAYAEHLRATGQGITNPAGYAKTIYRTGEDDPQIAAFLSSRQQQAAEKLSPRVDVSRCPDCNGTGYWYPEGATKGVTRCRHPKLTGTPSAPVSSRSHPNPPG